MSENLKVDDVVDAAARGDYGLVASAVETGFPLDAANANGWTPLMAAARNGRVEIVRRLLAAGADANQSNPNGTTPLMYAKTHCFASGDDTVMSLLLEAGADINARDKRGWTVLDYVETRQEQLVRYLRARGALRLEP